MPDFGADRVLGSGSGRPDIGSTPTRVFGSGSEGPWGPVDLVEGPPERCLTRDWSWSILRPEVLRGRRDSDGSGWIRTHGSTGVWGGPTTGGGGSGLRSYDVSCLQRLPRAHGDLLLRLSLPPRPVLQWIKGVYTDPLRQVPVGPYLFCSVHTLPQLLSSPLPRVLPQTRQDGGDAGGNSGLPHPDVGPVRSRKSSDLWRRVREVTDGLPRQYHRPGSGGGRWETDGTDNPMGRGLWVRRRSLVSGDRETWGPLVPSSPVSPYPQSLPGSRGEGRGGTPDQRRRRDR